MNDDELIEWIASEVAAPGWFEIGMMYIDEATGTQQHLYNNYPGQHLKFQDAARIKAREIIERCREGYVMKEVL